MKRAQLLLETMNPARTVVGRIEEDLNYWRILSFVVQTARFGQSPLDGQRASAVIHIRDVADTEQKDHDNSGVVCDGGQALESALGCNIAGPTYGFIKSGCHSSSSETYGAGKGNWR